MKKRKFFPDLIFDLEEDMPPSSIWRYMSISKYISLLQNKSLYFSPLTDMDDVFEGANYFDTLNVMLLYGRTSCKSKAIEGSDLKFLRKTVDNIKHFQKCFFACCFYSSEEESKIMFQSYSRENGVAIKFDSIEVLKQLIKYHSQQLDDVFNFNFGSVRYSSFRDDPKNNFLCGENGFKFNPFLKEAIYDHEKEYRFIFHKTMCSDVPENLTIKIDLKSSIKSIVAHPNCYDWEIEALKKLTNHYCKGLNIERSRLITPEILKRIL